VENIMHLYFNNTEEIRHRDGSFIVNFLSNRTVDRDYFTKLSVAVSVHTQEEYLFFNYMDQNSFCIHTPAESAVFTETYLHKHSFFELMYIMRGKATVMIEEEEVTYSAGNLCLMNHNTMHRETEMADADILYISIDPSLIVQWPKQLEQPFQYRSILNRFFTENLSERTGSKRDYVDFQLLGEDQIPTIAGEIIQAYTQKRIGYQFDIYSSLLRLFAVLENPEQYKATYVSMGYGRELVTLENAKRIIEENHGVIRRTELAKKLNYSCEYISQIIRAHTGYTFKKYCQKVQLQEAARLLRSTDLSVSKIAASLGYENRTQFYKIFQEEYQLTPSEYRKINH
jgi:AraC-like DNA-binding protein/mannose-6-phosphate isomerase-like protein (cupin superfamily)